MLPPSACHAKSVEQNDFLVGNAVLSVPLGLLWFLTNPPSFASQMPPPLPKEADESASYCMGSSEKELPVGLRIDLILFNDFDEIRRVQAPAVS